MKAGPALALTVAVLAHALLIGLLMGMSRSPIVGVVLPLLLGVGGYRLLAVFTGDAPSSSETAPLRLTPAIGWMAALWCIVVILAVLAGIELRTGSVRLGKPRVKTLSFVSLEHQPPARVPDLILICQYYDRLNLDPDQRKALVTGLADTTLSTSLLLSSLKDYFGSDRGTATIKPDEYGVFELRRPDTP